jgi:hypothetical protein
MSCTGYDSRTVKLPKSVKRSASTIMDTHKRGEFIRSYVNLLVAGVHHTKNRNFKERYK